MVVLNGKGFCVHARHFGGLLLVLPVLMSGVENVEAMNWEGHDAWFHDTAPFRAFYDGIPAPIVKPKPSCEERRLRHAANLYEQTPIPGVNCIADKTVPGEG